MPQEYPIPSSPIFQNISGNVYGKLTVLFYAGRRSSKYSLWHCRCSCGREQTIVSSRLTLGQTTQCNYCFRHQPKTKTRSDFIDLTGKVFGRLTVVSFSRRNKETNRTYFNCLCSCGESTESRADGLVSGSILSCGCLSISRKWIDQPVPSEGVCLHCKESLPMDTSNFYKHPKSKFGFRLICKPCFRSQRNSQSKAESKLLRMQALVAYSGDSPKCQCQGCNESNIEFLTIDHIGGGGRKHRLETNVYRWLRKNNFPPGFRVLCMNCNFSRGRYGYCPHCKGEK